MPLSRLGWLLLLSLAGLPVWAQPVKAPQPAKAAEPAPAPKAIRPEPALAGPSWDGSQFVRADRKGKVFLFRGSTFEVYPQTADGALGEPVRLESTAERSTMVLDAVLNPAGDQWLVQADVGARLFVSGKEKAVPLLHWRPWSIAFLRNTPVVAVVPIPVGGFSLDLENLSEVPWLYSLGNGRWETLVDQRDLAGKDVAKAMRDNEDVVAGSAIFMSADHTGKLWVGRQYAYRVERWSASGRPLDEIVVGGGKVEEKKYREEDSSADPKNYHRFTAKPAIRDLVEGTDHRMYFLVTRPDGALVLDRYDPALAVLERVPLDVMKKSSRFTLAAGKDGLYLAAWNGREGRWRITWEAIEEADWQKVEEAEIRAGSASKSAS
jgi:hypothetical protein